MTRPELPRGSSSGAVALEFALTLPLFMMLLAGAVALGMVMMARFQVDSAAKIAARTCVLRGEADDACAETEARARLGGAATIFCASDSLDVQAVVEDLGEGGVLLFRVDVTCQPGFTLGRALLPTVQIAGRGAMPYL